ncbi:MAG TPA: cyclopropane-fatty-acyl-phospholipid synthase family protein [Solirubrobacteraceae bacterium]|nr:cyclopropane-fatty-acyl-phospholipid synthase family protein [Solirubrobacteraceae bacterium]
MPGVAEAVWPVVERLDRRAPGARDFGLRFWDGSEVPPPPTADDELTLVVRDPVALAYALRQPNELGFGRAWVTGALDVDGDLERGLALRDRFGGLRLSAADRLAALRAVARLGAVRLRGPAVPASEAPVGRGRRHSLDRDRVAVRHHYDVSNAFYRMVLGPTMVYSCAYFSSPDDTLEEAQTRKLETICRKLRLRAGDRLLDIGCGWGALVLHAAREHGGRAVGVTLSEPQAELARGRIRNAGLSDRCEIRVADYREVDDGPYDKVASVGMYEHVGRAHLGEYVGRVTRLLREGGLFLNHGIVRAQPRLWDKHSFIARYVFPDGELHPVGALVDAMERAGLEIRDDEALREHYALTLRRWVANLAANRDAAIAEAGTERERVWRLYMTGSALAFEAGDISVHQVLAAKPGAPHELPLAREALLAGLD